MTKYVIALDQGDYYQQRGGWDWGRCDKIHATVFDSRAAAQREIETRKLRSFSARIEEAL